jgi:DNA-binding NarL/FixJ family response regulator
MISALFGVPAHYLPAFSLTDMGLVFSPEGGSAKLEHQARPTRVLIVEDDYFVSIEIETVLLDMHCEVIGIAATGEEAVKLAERERPDLILMDVRLAGKLNGIDAAMDVHTRLGIRSLFVTAHSDQETRKRGEQANPVGWASKPFTSHQLMAAVQAALKTIKPKP